MKLKTRIINGFTLHKSSEDFFHLFNFKNSDLNFQYENTKKIFWALNDFDKKSKIWPDFKINEKLINVELEEAPHLNSFTVEFFNKEELEGLIDDLLKMSYERNKYMHLQIKALKQNWKNEKWNKELI